MMIVANLRGTLRRRSSPLCSEPSSSLLSLPVSPQERCFHHMDNGRPKAWGVQALVGPWNTFWGMCPFVSSVPYGYVFKGHPDKLHFRL